MDGRRDPPRRAHPSRSLRTRRMTDQGLSVQGHPCNLKQHSRISRLTKKLEEFIMLGTINPEILFLQQEDQIKAGLLDMKMILKITEDTYKMLGQARSRPRRSIWASRGDGVGILLQHHAQLHRRRSEYRRYQVGRRVQEERHHPRHPLRHRHFHPQRPRYGPALLYSGRHHHHRHADLRCGGVARRNTAPPPTRIPRR